MKEILFCIFHPIRAIRIYLIKRKAKHSWNITKEMSDELFNRFIDAFTNNIIKLLEDNERR